APPPPPPPRAPPARGAAWGPPGPRGPKKPHPLLVHTALRLLEVPPDAALLVGDTFMEDVAVAHAAGIDAAWIDREGRGVPAGAVPPRFVLQTFPDLARVL